MSQLCTTHIGYNDSTDYSNRGFMLGRSFASRPFGAGIVDRPWCWARCCLFTPDAAHSCRCSPSRSIACDADDPYCCTLLGSHDVDVVAVRHGPWRSTSADVGDPCSRIWCGTFSLDATTMW